MVLLAWSYAALSLVLLSAAMLSRDYTITFWALLLAMPLLGLVILTLGRVGSDDPTTPVQVVIFLAVNTLWCFVFSWCILRVLLQMALGIASLSQGLKRGS